MKKENEMKPKLQLNKSVVTRLTIEEQSNVLGGAALTSSYGSCTGWLCCSGETVDVTSGPANDCGKCPAA